MDLGNSYLVKGDWDKAIVAFTEAIKIDPKSKLAYANRGGAYIQMGDYDTAIADLSEAIRIDDRFASAFNKRGAAYIEKGLVNKAISDLSEAIRISPKVSRRLRQSRGHVPASEGRVNVVQAALSRRYEGAELQAFGQFTVSVGNGQQSRLEAWKAVAGRS